MRYYRQKRVNPIRGQVVNKYKNMTIAKLMI